MALICGGGAFGGEGDAEVPLPMVAPMTSLPTCFVRAAAAAAPRALDETRGAA